MADRPTEARHPHSAGLHALPGQTALSHLLDAQLAALATVRPAIPAIEQAATAAAIVANTNDHAPNRVKCSARTPFRLQGG